MNKSADLDAPALWRIAAAGKVRSAAMYRQRLDVGLAPLYRGD